MGGKRPAPRKAIASAVRRPGSSSCMKLGGKLFAPDAVAAATIRAARVQHRAGLQSSFSADSHHLVRQAVFERKAMIATIICGEPSVEDYIIAVDRIFSDGSAAA